MPLATGARYEVCLKLSLEWVLEICTSITGVEMALTASAMPIEVWV